MKATKCKICGAIEWGHVCRGPIVTLDGQPLLRAGKPLVASDLRPGDIVEISSAPKKRAPRGTFDRNAYQRDLMRKRRAKPIP